MAGQYTGLQKSYRIDPTNKNPFNSNKNEIPLYTIVTQSGENLCKLPEQDNVVPLGAIVNDERLYDALGDGGDQANRQIAVMLNGIASIRLGDTVAVGDRIIAGEGGRGIPMPSTAGTYNVIGFAEKGGEEGDVIPVRMAYHTFVVE